MKERVEKLRSIIEENGLSDSLKEELDAITAPQQIRIGMLGEFSSGKSSIVNALIGEEIIPAMTMPTTGTLTFVDFSGEEDTPQFFSVTKEGWKPISREEFNSISMGKVRGVNAGVRVKPQDERWKNLMVVDTPGVNSLEAVHREITLGFLPFLDAGIVCIDVQRGTIPKTVKEFLLDPVIQSLQEYLAIAITKVDLKPQSARDRIKGDVLAKTSWPESMVFMVSTIEDTGSEGLKDLSNWITNGVIAREAELYERRVLKGLPGVMEKVALALMEKADLIDFSDQELEGEYTKYRSALRQIEKEKEALDSRIKDTARSLGEKVKNIAAGRIKGITTLEEVEEVFSQLLVTIEGLINQHIEGLLGNEVAEIDSSVLDMYKGILINEIKDIYNKARWAEIIGTSILAALTGGGASIGPIADTAGSFGVADILEGMAGAAIAMSGDSKDGTSKKQKKPGWIKRGLMFINKLNPVHIGVSFIRDRYVLRTVKQKADAIAEGIALVCEDQVSQIGYSHVIEPIKEKIKDHLKMLEEVNEKKRKKREEIALEKKRLMELAEELRAEAKALRETGRV